MTTLNTTVDRRKIRFTSEILAEVKGTTEKISVIIRTSTFPRKTGNTKITNTGFTLSKLRKLACCVELQIPHLAARSKVERFKSLWMKSSMLVLGRLAIN